MNKFPRWYAWLCYLAVPISGVGVDIYTPSLPSIAHYFHTSSSLAQLSLSVYLIGFGLSQLFIGPITDRHGRRPTLIASLLIFMVLCLLIAFSTTPWELLVGRCLQGIAGAGISVPIRAMLADISDPETFKKRVNYMIFAWGLGPVLAPWIGSHLQHTFNWQANFYFLTAYGLIALVLTLISRETHIDRQAHLAKPMLANHKTIFTTRFFIPAAIFTGLCYAIMIAYGTIGPFLVEEKLKLSVLVFGRTSLLMGVAWILGSLINRLLIKTNLNVKTTIVLTLMMLITVFMGVEARLQPNSFWLLVTGIVTLTFLGSIVFSALVTYTLSYFQSLAGSANAALFAGVWTVSGITSSIASHLSLHTISLFALALLIIVIASAIVYGITASLMARKTA